MNLLSPNDRFPLPMTGIRLCDIAERHEWRGPDEEKVVYRRLCLDDCKIDEMSILDGIVDWKGFYLDGEEAPFNRDLAEGLPHNIQTEVRAGIRGIDSDGGNRGESVLYYRVPVLSVIDRLRRRAMVRGEVDYSRYVPEMIRWALAGWDNVITSDGNPADFNPENVGKLPLGAVNILWDRISRLIAGEELRGERELKNSTPTSGD